MKSTLSLPLILLIPICSFSQDFRVGYIVTNEKDTLRGWVKNVKGKKAQSTCSFKKSERGEIITYGPNQLKGYGIVDDSYFESRTIKKEDGASDIVFAEVILKGFGSLYKFDRSYWIDKEGQADWVQLRNEFKEVYVGDKLVRKKTNQFVSTLGVQLADCEGLGSAIQKVTLSARQLSRLMIDYNKCKRSPFKIFNMKPPVTARFGISGGLNTSTFKMVADNNNTYNAVATGVTFQEISGTYAASTTPIFGVTLDLLLPRFNEHVSIVTGVSYLSTKYTNGSPGTYNYASIELQQLKVPLGFRYTISEKSVGIFFNAGFSTTIHLHSDFKWWRSNSTNYDNSMKIGGNQMGLWGGIGVEKSIGAKWRASLEGRGEATDGIVGASHYGGHLTTSISNFQIIFSVKTK